MEPKRLHTWSVSWYVTQLHPWHYFGGTFKGNTLSEGEAIFSLNMIIKEKTSHFWLHFFLYAHTRIFADGACNENKKLVAVHAVG